jgi:predicted Rossmann fold nucleotide-binding protein DprA/Smf involved in DNA uptake
LKGNTELLQKPCISLVGSRDIRQNNLIFAQEVGRQAAKQGYVLVSGNARGADRAAQLACLQAGGQIICVVADELTKRHPAENVLCISEDCFDAPFSSLRALSRNRLIHCLSDRIFVAQCDNGHGGTWDGTARNLKSGWSRVFCFQDGSDACSELMQMGADPIDLCNLYNFSSLSLPDSGLFGQ